MVLKHSGMHYGELIKRSDEPGGLRELADFWSHVWDPDWSREMVCVWKAERARPPAPLLHWTSPLRANRSGAEHEERKPDVWESDLFLLDKTKQSLEKENKQRMGETKTTFVIQTLGKQTGVLGAEGDAPVWTQPWRRNRESWGPFELWSYERPWLLFNGHFMPANSDSAGKIAQGRLKRESLKLAEGKET